MAEPDTTDAPAPAGAEAPASAPPAGAAEAAALDPRVEQLRAAVDHFVAGNFAAARRTARELLRGEVPPELRKQADELVRRMGLDPVALWIAVGSTLLFIVVVVLTFRH
ncbi:MAG: hypothetical protein HY906_27445 [Deltaproteobacteria bacterium]|nr:hypothetical protein [Deltaproteobacteria bacterium]